MDVLLVLGCQDLFPAAGPDPDPAVDDCLGWLADVLAEEGIVATYLFQAERAEQLAARGRRDVVQKVARHEVGLHARDRHPTYPEAVEELDWPAGLAAVAQIEADELAALARVFDRPPVCSSAHGPCSAPQLFALARQRAQPYLFGYPAAPPLYSVSWYAGALSVPCGTPTPDFLGFTGVYDRALPDDAEFARSLDLLRAHVERCRLAGQPLLSVFLCHPERLVCPDPVAHLQFGDGQNRPAGTWEHRRSPRRRSRDDLQRALANFRRLVRTVRDDLGLTPITVAELARLYGQEPATLARPALAAVAARAGRERAVVLSEALSPAEALTGWAESLLRWQATGTLPERVARRPALGPLTAPRACPDLDALAPDDLLALARALLDAASASGHLPADLALGRAQVGLGALYGALALAYGQAQAGARLATVPLDVSHRAPALGTALAQAARSIEQSPIARPGLRTDALARYTQLQTWTLKPAARAG